MAGGAILGYCAMGNVPMASTPASITMIASTQAKIGRSMKKLTMAERLFRGSAGRGCRGSRWRALFTRCRRVLLGRDLGTRFCRLQSFYDDAIADLEPRGHHPLIGSGAISRENPELYYIVRAHDQRVGLALLIVRDALLRCQHRVLTRALLDLLAHEHARQQQAFGIGHQRSQRDRAR